MSIQGDETNNSPPGQDRGGVAKKFGDWLAGRSRATTEADAAVAELAAAMAEGADSCTAARVVAQLACRMGKQAGAVRAELWRDRSRLAVWPDDDSHADDGRPSIILPIRCGGATRGALKLVVSGGRPLDASRRRRLESFATLALAMALEAPDANGDRSAAAGGRSRTELDAHPRPAVHPTHDPITGLPNGCFLRTFLGYGISGAERRDAPISLLAIQIDRFAAIETLHGQAVANDALRRVARTIVRSLRTSDVIARLDGGRLVAVLPDTPASGARQAAEMLRATVATRCAASPTMPVLTVTVGAATFPDHAGDAVTLLAAAASTLDQAHNRGRDLVATAAAHRAGAGAGGGEEPDDQAPRLRVVAHSS